MDSDAPITKRTIALAVLAVFAAMPLVWFTVDASAGERLLRLTTAATQSQTMQR